ncbi:DUF7859 family protein [Candidatus Halobonum tyrrellensis]|uniref:DUF7859 family protein n=1 Tax=Candidatus Halobonum tyrrellensis TaxID=1431545 RepID=UPI00190FBC97|nr:hypothetical protein [Candidatus Halobonum tyrrellensis]
MDILDTLAEALAANPVLAGILVVLLILVFGAYLFVRRIFVSAKEGYDAGRQER